jgi:hypothetical protein
LESVESSPSLLAYHAMEQKSNKRLKARTITGETKREGQKTHNPQEPKEKSIMVVEVFSPKALLMSPTCKS